MDGGWFLAIGTVAGASVAGAFDLGKLAVQSRADKGRREHEASEAKAQRDASAAETAAQREDDRRTKERAERATQITEWRRGLADSHTRCAQWDALSRRKTEVMDPQPNINTEVWFQSLRPHLDGTDNNNVRYLLESDDIDCDTDNADTLSKEISRIEREWLAE